jgi:hypothetical protein
MTRALLGRFRSTWLESPLPMVVEHGSGRPETICAAPSLWMGGKLVAERLREGALGPGDRVAYVGPSRAGYVQALVGCLRAGVTFLPCELALDGLGAHATVGEDLLVARGGAAPQGDPAVRMLFEVSGAAVGLTDDELDALASDAGVLLHGEDVRIGSTGDWTDWRFVTFELLGGLFAGAEIHVVGRDVSAAQLAMTGSLPNVIVRREGDAFSLPAMPSHTSMVIDRASSDATLLLEVAVSPRRETLTALRRIGVT